MALLSVLSGIYPEVEWLDNMVILFLIFLGMAIMFSIAAVPCYTPISTAQGFQFSHVLANTRCFLLVFIITVLMGVR